MDEGVKPFKVSFSRTEAPVTLTSVSTAPTFAGTASGPPEKLNLETSHGYILDISSMIRLESIQF